MSRKKRKEYQEYMVREYGFSFPLVRALWGKAERTWRKRDRTNSLLKQLGIKRSVSEQFFFLGAQLMNKQSVAYPCVNGCCVIMWHPVKGYHSGWGPAGCPCGDMLDPRGPNPKPLAAP